MGIDPLYAGARRVLLTTWLGTHVGVGYLVAPVLFARLDTRALAGDLAGELFFWSAWIGIGVLTVLVTFDFVRRRPPRWRLWQRRLLSMALILLLISELIVHPVLQHLRDAPQGPGTAFLVLHGVSQLMHLAVSVLGLIVVASWGDSKQPLEGLSTTPERRALASKDGPV